MNIDYNQHQEVETKMNHARRNLFSSIDKENKGGAEKLGQYQRAKNDQILSCSKGEKGGKNTQSMAQEDNNNNNNNNNNN